MHIKLLHQMGLITGFSISKTVTLKEQVAVLPAASVANTLMVVVPTGKFLI